LKKKIAIIVVNKSWKSVALFYQDLILIILCEKCGFVVLFMVGKGEFCLLT